MGSFYPLGKLGSFGVGLFWRRGVWVSRGSLDGSFSFFHFCLGPIPHLVPKEVEIQLCKHKPKRSFLEESLQAGRAGEINPPQEARSISCGPIKPAKAGGLYLSLTSAFDVSLQSPASLLQLAFLLSWNNW